MSIIFARGNEAKQRSGPTHSMLQTDRQYPSFETRHSSPQAAYGNQFVLRMLNRSPRASLQRKCACGGECTACKERRQLMAKGAVAQRARFGSIPPIVHEVLRSPGQPLDVATRSYFEPRFGHSFESVRIHTGSTAAKAATSVS